MPPTTWIGMESTSGVGERDEVALETEGARLRFREGEEEDVTFMENNDST